MGEFDDGFEAGLWGADGIPYCVDMGGGDDISCYDEPCETDEEEMLTYDEWQDRGRQVMRGQKGTRVDGEVVFSYYQTTEK